jgi:hypothetical protein
VALEERDQAVDRERVARAQIDGHQNHALRLLQDGHCVLDRARRLATAVPRHQNAVADLGE